MSSQLLPHVRAHTPKHLLNPSASLHLQYNCLVQAPSSPGSRPQPPIWSPCLFLCSQVHSPHRIQRNGFINKCHPPSLVPLISHHSPLISLSSRALDFQSLISVALGMLLFLLLCDVLSSFLSTITYTYTPLYMGNSNLQALAAIWHSLGDFVFSRPFFSQLVHSFCHLFLCPLDFLFHDGHHFCILAQRCSLIRL